MHNKYIHTVAIILLVIGGLNWLVIGINGTNVVEMILGNGTMITRVVYILVGLSAILEIALHKKHCLMCKGK